MKKALLIIGLIVLLPFLMLGFFFLESVYYEAMGFKAEKAALKYLDEKYGEDFEIDDVEYAKALGDEGGNYTLHAHPVEKREISFRIEASEKYKVTRDDYKESKWGEQFRKEMVQMFQPLFQDTGRVYAYGSFPEEVVDQYGIRDSYQSIFNENPLQSYERIHILNFEEPFEKEKELNRVYQLWEMVKDRQFKNNNIVVNYYPKELLEKVNTYSDLNQFENEHRKEMTYICRFSKEEAQKKPITSPGDFEAFCRKLR